jgi:5-methylcytosine-specific restriction endonuclease McrA
MENIKQCSYCGKDFEKKSTHSRSKWATMKSCSRSCAKMGHRAWNKGLAMPEEQKTHLKKVLSGRTCNTGRTHVKKGQSLSSKTQFKKGDVSYWKDKKNPHFTGPNNPKWKGGIYPEHLKIRHSVEMKRLVREALKRDNHTCQDCGIRDVEIFVHHIKSFAAHKEFRLDIGNLITVCGNCHQKRHN